MTGRVTVGLPIVSGAVELVVMSPRRYAAAAAEHGLEKRGDAPPAFSVCRAEPDGLQADVTMHADAARWTQEVLVHELAHAAEHVKGMQPDNVQDDAELLPQMLADLFVAIMGTHLAPEALA